MLRYTVEKELGRMLSVLNRILNIRITFFDMEEREISGFSIKGMSPFCRRQRRNPAFNARCVACDCTHLSLAKKSKEIHVYRCHAGLLEGIVPLLERGGAYLGAIVFGQVRPGVVPTHLEGVPARLFAELPSYSRKDMEDIGCLLKWVSEHMINSHLIHYRRHSWAAVLERFIHENIGQRLPLSVLSQKAHVSPSFLTHRFPEQFGQSPRQYVLTLRMLRARDLLQEGGKVFAVARDLGFYDEFHFSKSYKKFWGRSPTKRR